MRRMGCLSALFSLVLWVAVLAAIVWFGLTAYQHYTDYRAMADRNTVVTQAWAGDATTLAQAAAGAVVKPADISGQPFQQAGARVTKAFTSNGTSLVLATTRDTCAPDPLTVDVVETSVIRAGPRAPAAPLVPAGDAVVGRPAPSDRVRAVCQGDDGHRQAGRRPRPAGGDRRGERLLGEGLLSTGLRRGVGLQRVDRLVGEPGDGPGDRVELSTALVAHVLVR